MKDRPILFSGPMVSALLSGSKTQTRRVLKSQPPEGCSIHYMLGNESWLDEADRTPLRHHWEAWAGPLYQNRPDGHLCGVHTVKCPYGQPGDRLWVRETFGEFIDTDVIDGATHELGRDWVYRADGGGVRVSTRWTPSIHMPRAASRILLEIVSVRVERLNDCSDEDARAEGCPCYVCGGKLDGRSEDDCHCFHRKADASDYRNLWESINGEGSWAANPWVWCITFRRINP